MKTKYIPPLKYDFLTQYYDIVLNLFMRESFFKNKLLDKMNIRQERILDFGCGTATLTIMAKKRFPSAKVEGIDVDKKALCIADKKIKKEHLDIPVNTYNGKNLFYPDNNFDIIMSSLVFHHLAGDLKYSISRELLRTLKPGGKLFLLDFGKPSNLLMAVIAKLLSFIEPTEDNIKGKIPFYITKAGFINIKKTFDINTIFGTVSLYEAEKPANS